MKRLEDISLKENERKAITEAAAILRSQFPVVQVILFGSKARGDDSPESDMDLLILTSRPVTPPEKEAMTRALFALELERDVVISKVVVPQDSWEHGPYRVLPLHREIDRDGVAA